MKVSSISSNRVFLKATPSLPCGQVSRRAGGLRVQQGEQQAPAGKPLHGRMRGLPGWRLTAPHCSGAATLRRQEGAHLGEVQEALPPDRGC